MEIKRTITVTVLNEHGVLSRISGLFAGRGYNIESLTVAPILDSNLSRITIATKGDNRVLEQIIKQLNRLIDVLRVRDITDIPHLEREVILVKLTAPTSKRAEILAVIQPFRASVVDVAQKSITIQVTGDADKIEALIRVIKPYGIQNLARTGATGFSRDLS